MWTLLLLISIVLTSVSASQLLVASYEKYRELKLKTDIGPIGDIQVQPRFLFAIKCLLSFPVPDVDHVPQWADSHEPFS